MNKKTKFIAVIEIELPVTSEDEAEKSAKLFCETINSVRPKIAEIYEETHSERKLIYNQ